MAQTDVRLNMVDVLYKKDTNAVKLLEKEELSELLETVKAFEHAPQYEVYDALSALAFNYVKLTLAAKELANGTGKPTTV